MQSTSSKKFRLIKETLVVLAIATPGVADAASHRETTFTRPTPDEPVVQQAKVKVLRADVKLPRANH